ncbi:hypothetical protein HKX17_18390 [Sulfitobacter sp. KE34]|uniref:hypothetical protein n=1 Tax=unclassified Sulfitobacter TaxID=196795 RepID=UPI0023E22E4D|nr:MULTISPECIES: hypothetical protein [unclassified Sulfitobacter]MDF3352116.1 hypothetical protein [Sulfitobacter sp. KE12]MDF3355772.1 hypothetical protein [Sulfitobacter sp. KE27]MDF3359408.1 hypothetical protein [Sulfitobacter sp. KE33]MDF3366832.1 hypothetical protein [Sulfitobacter sp. Ks34]MDF3370454.1 hypothetical protein [Sulfitobacter sp. Ks43]
MNAVTPQNEFVGVGLYTINEAAKLLRSSPRTIRRWVEGYDYRRNGEKIHSASLWQPDISLEGSVELSFRDLIELRFIIAFTELGLSIQTIRSCLDAARECIESDRPFSSGRFRTDGRRIFLQGADHLNDPVLIDLKRRQYVFNGVIERTFKDLDLEDDLVTRWRPYRGKESIVIDPTRSFGQPISSDFGVPTIVLAEAVQAEGSVARVAALYEVDRTVVADAVRYHGELAAA